MPFDLSHSDTNGAFLERVNNSSLIRTTAPSSFYEQGLKRGIDIFLVALSAVIIAPIVLVIAFFISLDGHSPFYSQSRIGRDGKHFRLFKLRTMVADADALLAAHLNASPAARREWDETQKLKDDPRITRFGRILRRTSLDELPQLFNVFLGDMSLVGPRPMMPSQQKLYPGIAYYSLRPGVTGLWQISDRNESAFSARAKFDDVYGQVVSLPIDIAILFRTVLVVLRGTGY